MKWKSLGVLVALVLVLVPGPSHALSFTVDSTAFTVGDTFSINLNVADAVDLTSWQFDLRYDPTILRTNTVMEGSFLSAFGATFFTPGVIDNTTGLISLVANSFVDFTPTPNGSGVLASIGFTALSGGTPALTASNVFLNFLDSGFTVTNGSVCVNGAAACGVGGGVAGTSVPEPGSLALLIVGGLMVWGMRRWSDRGAETHE